ncbi:hypothetical protein L0Z72_09680 [candidate division KSB1 bacterium]|nr:hypothetical protein [candidate division KSB1 bacterium]
MEKELDPRIYLIPKRGIRWTFAAVIVIILGLVFLLIHHYLYKTVQHGLSSAYLTFVLTLFVIWFLGIIFYMIYMVLKYDPFKNPDSPYIKETMGLPPGVFRAIITLTLLFAIVLLEGYALTNMDQHEQIQKVLDPLNTGFQLMIAFYFGTKMVDMISGKDKDEPTPKG